VFCFVGVRVKGFRSHIVRVEPFFALLIIGQKNEMTVSTLRFKTRYYSCACPKQRMPIWPASGVPGLPNPENLEWCLLVAVSHFAVSHLDGNARPPDLPNTLQTRAGQAYINVRALT
jgi:hypothetical protein